MGVLRRLQGIDDRGGSAARSLPLLAASVSLLVSVGVCATAGAVTVPTPAPTDGPPGSCRSCAEVGAACTLTFGAAGKVIRKSTRQPVPYAEIAIEGLELAVADGSGNFTLTGTRDESCTLDYAFAISVGAEGFKPYAFSGYFSALALPFNLTVELEDENGGPPPTPTPTCTPGAPGQPGCQGPPPTEPPTPPGPVLRIEPPSLPRIACSGDFDVHLRNVGGSGSVLTIQDISLSHGYSQGDYGTGFHWDLSPIQFPVLLEAGATLDIPISYSALDQNYASRLHFAVDSDSIGETGGAVYFGALCNTPTPVGPVLAIEPLVFQRFDCSGAFDLELTNVGSPGSVLTIQDVMLSNSYSQGDYGTGFHWDLSRVGFPVPLEAGQTLAIPITYSGLDQTFPSRLGAVVDSDSIEPPINGGPYFAHGNLCATPTPTPQVPLAELVPSAVRVIAPSIVGCVPPGPFDPQAHNEVCVLNQGTAAAGAFDVVLRNSSFMEIDRFRVSALGSNGEHCMFTEYRPFEIEVVVDPEDEVAESHEDNNRRSFAVAALTPPPMCSPTPSATPSVTRAPTLASTSSSGGGCDVSHGGGWAIVATLSLALLAIHRRTSI